MVQALKLKMKEQKGFTLIELLAVIVILGIIAAIAIPAIGNVISKSDTKATAQDGVQIINAAKMYMANNPSVTFTSNEYTVSETDLHQYLERVKHGDKTYSVVVTKNATTGNLSYKLKGTHPANTVGDTNGGTPEQTLVDAAK